MGTEKTASAGSVAVGDVKLKMVKNPAGFQEPEADVAQGETDFSGPNPYPKDSWRAQCWERLKADSKQ